ncbi:hypothetical protein ACI0FS_18310, partial [Ochrobactrum quorumnocens]|uniref:hypothetical protein n=1 Tax=Ochrobactrum quorumnocens TaxID=271865 RepID=UPI003851B286
GNPGWVGSWTLLWKDYARARRHGLLLHETLGPLDSQGPVSGSVAKILPMSERVLTIFSETFDERFQVAPFSG